MTQTDIRLVVNGPGAETLAGEVSELVLEDFGYRIDPMPAGAANSGPGKKVDPALVLGVAGFVLSLPAAALKVMDLADRLKKRKKAEIFLEKLNAFLDAHPGAELSISKPDGTLTRIREVTADGLLEFFGED